MFQISCFLLKTIPHKPTSQLVKNVQWLPYN